MNQSQEFKWSKTSIFTQSTHFLILSQQSFVMANYNYLIFFFTLFKNRKTINQNDENRNIWDSISATYALHIALLQNSPFNLSLLPYIICSLNDVNLHNIELLYI